MFDARTLREVAAFRGHSKDVALAAWHPWQQEAFVSGDFDGNLCHWLLSSPSPLVRLCARLARQSLGLSRAAGAGSSLRHSLVWCPADCLKYLAAAVAGPAAGGAMAALASACADNPDLQRWPGGILALGKRTGVEQLRSGCWALALLAQRWAASWPHNL